MKEITALLIGLFGLILVAQGFLGLWYATHPHGQIGTAVSTSTVTIETVACTKADDGKTYCFRLYHYPTTTPH